MSELTDDPVPKHVRDAILGGRVRGLNADDTVYHYCSAETAVAILNRGTIRFSDLNVLNDAEEGVWGYRVFEEAKRRIVAREDLPPEFPTTTEEFLTRLDEYWNDFPSHSVPLVACFSLEGDSLSQWRAYSDDGRGLAIGFSGQGILSMPCRNVTVCYDPQQQLQEMVEAIGFALKQIDELDVHEEADGDEIFEVLAMFLVGCSVAFKNPAFRDER